MVAVRMREIKEVGGHILRLGKCSEISLCKVDRLQISFIWVSKKGGNVEG
jgi:hypothetical protein